MKTFGLLLATIVLGAPVIASAEEVTASGCVRRGVETGCLVLSANGKGYDVTAAQPTPEVGTYGTVTGTVYGGVGICMQGIILKPSTWKPDSKKPCKETE